MTLDCCVGLITAGEHRAAPLLIFVNKMDLPNAMNVGEVEAAFGLPGMLGPKATARPYFLQACSATAGNGLYEGFEWLSW